MENLGLVRKATALGILLVAIASTCGANTILPVRGGSHYGANSSDPNFFTDCLNGTVTLACEAFNPNTTVISFNGVNYNVFEFVTGNTGMAGTRYEVIDLGSVGPNSTFTLPTAFFPVASTEIFSCNYHENLLIDQGSLVDSGPSPFNGPCTANLETNPGLSQDGTSFITDKNFNVFNLVLDARVTAVSAPEPSSIILLGAGLLGVWGGRKRLLIR